MGVNLARSSVLAGALKAAKSSIYKALVNTRLALEPSLNGWCSLFSAVSLLLRNAIQQPTSGLDYDLRNRDWFSGYHLRAPKHFITLFSPLLDLLTKDDHILSFMCQWIWASRTVTLDLAHMLFM